jgi:hypothetical protein
MSKPIVLNFNDWVPASIKYMAPKVNEKGGKAINIISKQSNRSLHITTPLMMTWGISDFVDEKGEADGKYSITLNFPNADYENESTRTFQQKLKEFESQLIDDAVANYEAWWGEDISSIGGKDVARVVLKNNFFPVLKYSKNKDTKKVDLSKPPSIRAKVPNYNNKWAVEIYDTKSNMIFPCDNELLTPVDFIPKMSSVACVLQCGGIWIGGKGWGLTWKLIQCMVKPREVVSVYGKCQIQLSNEDKTAIETQEIKEEVEDTSHEEERLESKGVVDIAPSQPVAPAQPVSTVVDDTDDEAEPEKKSEPVAPAPVAVENVQVVMQEEQSAPPKPAVKKVVKKAEPVAAEPVAAATEEVKPSAAPVKKVVRKVAAAK